MKITRALSDRTVDADRVVGFVNRELIPILRQLMAAANSSASSLEFVSVTETGQDSVNTHVTVGTLTGAITRLLPLSPTTGDVVEHKAPSNAATFNVTVSGNGNTVDGAPTRVLTTNRQFSNVVWNGTEWEISQ